jgi:hypothetical protein
MRQADEAAKRRSSIGRCGAMVVVVTERGE